MMAFRNVRYHAFACGLLLTAPVMHAHGQRADTTRLERVIVTADRVERSLRHTSSTVTVLDGAALRDAGIMLVLEALRATPGIAVVQSGGPGSQASIFSRGGESDYTRLLIDGVPQNDPGGAVDLSTLTTDNIDRIEIVRGPGSVLYGSDAVAAVVHVFTRRASATDVQMNVTAGSLGQRTSGIEAQWRRDNVGIAAGASDQRFKGALPINNEFDNSVGSVRATFGTAASVSVRHGFSRYEYPTDGAGNVVDENANQRERRTVASAEATRPITRSLAVAAVATALESHRRTSDAPDGIGDSTGFYAYQSAGVVRRRSLDTRLQHNAAISGATTLGVETAWEQQRLSDSSNYSVSQSRFNAERRNVAVYLQNSGANGPISWTVGGRLDDNSEFGDFGTVRAGLAAQVGGNVRIRLSGGSSYKAPTFFESNATAFTNGNADLVPERGRSIEAGADFEHSWFSGSVVWFEQRFRNLIQYAYAAAPAADYFNIAAARASGIEGEVGINLNGKARVHGAVTALRTRVDDAGLQGGMGDTFAAGARLLRRPSVTVNAGISTMPGRFGTGSVALLRVGARDDLNFAGFPAERVQLSPYIRLDLSAHSPRARILGSDAAVTVRLQNATGARYQEIANFRAPGRQLVVGLRLSGSSSASATGR